MKATRSLSALLFILFFNALFSQTDPNIVLIIADDMGWSQVSTGLTNLNNPSDFYETPNIETLASQGIAFPHAYVNGANCAPTRAALLSGQYAARPTNNVFNVYDLNRGNTSSNSTLIGPDMGLASNNNIDEIPASAITIAETMKVAGYTTAHLGKFHVGENESSNTSNNAPTDQGFDYNYGGGTDGAPGSYFASSNSPYTFGSNIGPELDAYADPYTSAESLMLAGDNSLTGTKKHVTDAMADAAIDFMEAEKNNPFFMHFSNYAIHGPFNQSNARLDLYAKYDVKTPSQMGHDSKGQAAIAEGMDQTIGRLVDYLKTTADPRNPGKMLSENTLVYFISDNGGAIHSDDAGPLRGMKGEYYEGGIRSVTIAWSEASWLVNKGTVNPTPILAFDLYPTFVEAAGGTLPSNYDIDGASQWQMLTNGTSMTREALYWHFPGYLIDSKRDSRPVSIVRKGDYKLRYNYETLSYELFNLITDISEGSNLLAGNPDEATLIIGNDMSTLLRNHLIDTSAPLPTYRSDGSTCPLPYIIDTTPTGGGGGLCEAPTGYSAYWNFDIANGANDGSGNGHNPAPINGTLLYDAVDFKEGDQSAVFDGTVDIQYSSGSFLTNALTTKSYTVWLKPTALSGLQEVMDEGGGNQGLALRLNGSTLEGAVRSGTTNLSLTSAPYPNDGDWHHVAMVYNGGITSLKLYIDGVEVSSENSALSSVNAHTGIGGIGGVIGGKDAFGETSDSYFIGKMDGYAVYNNALSLSQIEEAACLSTQVVANAGTDVTICENDSTTLTASGGTSYLWSTGATTASIDVTPTLTTTYTVTVSDGTTSDDDDVIVTVTTLPTADAGVDVSICEGDSTTLIVSGGDTYLWSTGVTTASISVSPTSTTTYSVTVTQNECSSNDDVIVTVNTLPVADAGADVTINEGESTTLTASGGGAYLWSTGATTASINVSPTLTTTYSVTVSQNGCSSNDDVIVTVNPVGCSYSVLNSEGFESGWGIWNDGGSDSRRSSKDAIYATSGTYCVRLRDNTSTSVMTTDNLNLTTYEEITVDFAYYCRSMDNSNEDFWFQVSTNGGSNFTTIEEWNRDDEFVNNQFNTGQVIISGPFTSTMQFRFRVDASGNSDWAYIDDIVIGGCSTGGSAKIVSKKRTGNLLSIEGELPSNEITSILHPNPFVDRINIKIEEVYNKADVEVLNILGQSLYFKTFINKEVIEVPTRNFQNGQYLIRITVDDKIIMKRAIKK